jgi:photosystem II stability/assembly factor-like uncharacterized protein
MTHISKSCFTLFLSLTLLTFTTGCGRPDLSELGNDITCYAATYSKGIYKSDNGGISWYPLDLDQEDLYLYFKKVFLGPDKSTLYVTTTGAGLFIIDQETGSLDSVSQFKDETVRAIAFRNSSSGQGEDVEILAGMNSRGIFKALQNPDKWEPFNKGLTYRDVNVLLVDGKDIFAGTINDLFQRDEASKGWKSISGDIENKNIISIGVDPQGDSMYVGSGSFQDERGFFASIPCLYKSTDQGKTWKASDRGIPDDTLVYVISVNPGKPERIYLGTSEGLFRSTNSGKRWSKMEDGLPDELRVFDIKIVRVADDRALVYAASSNGVFMTLDDNRSPWVDRSYGLEKTNITSIALTAGNR